MAEQQFRARAYKNIRKTTPNPDATGGPWPESVHGVEWAEAWLLENGKAHESFVDLYFNGESVIHTSVYYLEAGWGGVPPLFGIANSSKARWPVEYVYGEGVTMSGGEDEFGRILDEWMPGDSDEDETDNTEPTSGSTPEKKADTESKGESDEFPVEENDEDEEESEPEEDQWEDEEDSEDENDEQDGSSGKDSDDGDGEEDSEMPRLMLFAKMRGPKGWRKRAETDHERSVNRFGLKIGVLDESAGTSARQERDNMIEVSFTEMDSNRFEGELKVKLPDGIEFHRRGNHFVAAIPYLGKDEI